MNIILHIKDDTADKALKILAEKRSAADGGETVNGKETNRVSSCPRILYHGMNGKARSYEK